MPTFEKESTFDAAPGELFAWHTRPGAFERLAPPWQRIRLLHREGTIRDGDTLEFEFKAGPIPIRWKACHEDYVEGKQFCDIQEKGPFREWRHRHIFEPAGGGCVMRDRIEYELPAMSAIVAGRKVADDLDRLFWYRHERLRRDLERHRAFPRDPLRIAVSGSSGTLGSALVPFLSTGGHTVFRLVREKPEAENEIEWNPSGGRLDPKALEGFDAVINLSGESIAEGRWTDEKKQRLRRSRIDTARLLAETMASLSRPPEVFLCASAVGYYDARDDEPKTEGAGKGDGFLPDLCEEWEAACGPAREAGIRTVNMRFGAVLTPAGGVLDKMLPVFRKGLGGPVGSGEQGFSWIGIDDVLGGILFLLGREDLDGPVNMTAPHPVSNGEFSRALGRVLHRPAFLRVPGFVIRGVFGEMGEEVLLEGPFVVPGKLQEKGFEFRESEIGGSLRWEMGIPGDEDAE
jgi:uncharacterized protein (TIGR01777 family)